MICVGIKTRRGDKHGLSGGGVGSGMSSYMVPGSFMWSRKCLEPNLGHLIVPERFKQSMNKSNIISGGESRG